MSCCIQTHMSVHGKSFSKMSAWETTERFNALQSKQDRERKAGVKSKSFNDMGSSKD